MNLLFRLSVACIAIMGLNPVLAKGQKVSIRDCTVVLEMTIPRGKGQERELTLTERLPIGEFTKRISSFRGALSFECKSGRCIETIFSDPSTRAVLETKFMENTSTLTDDKKTVEQISKLVDRAESACAASQASATDKPATKTQSGAKETAQVSDFGTTQPNRSWWARCSNGQLVYINNDDGMICTMGVLRNRCERDWYPREAAAWGCSQ